MIAHIGIYTNQLEALKKFYEVHFHGVSGSKYTNVNKGFESYFVSFECGAKIELMKSLGITNSINTRSVGFAHLAFKLGSADLVDKKVCELRSFGIKIVSEARLTGDGYYEAVIEDIDGNLIELVA